jgi:predicted solute-binding protein
MLHGGQRGEFDLSFAVPSECADRLARREVDIGIVPVVEVARQKLKVLEGAGIGSRGTVRSLLIVSKVPIERIRVLAADASSRTTIALARIVLTKTYGVSPEMRIMPPDLEGMLSVADAALIIGDPALRLDPSKLPYLTIDMGEEWDRLTGLPMVYAVWAGHKDALYPGIERRFNESCRFGIEHLDEIVRAESATRSIPEQLTRDYFTHNVSLEMTSRDYEGMRLFLSYAAESDMLVLPGKRQQ